MDNNVLNMILDKLQVLDRIEKEVSGIKEEVSGIKEEIKVINNRLGKLEINQEESKKNLEIVIEALQVNQETQKRKTNKLIKDVKEDTYIIKNVVKNISDDIDFLKEKEHKQEIDIFKIKKNLLRY